MVVPGIKLFDGHDIVVVDVDLLHDGLDEHRNFSLQKSSREVRVAISPTSSKSVPRCWPFARSMAAMASRSSSTCVGDSREWDATVSYIHHAIVVTIDDMQLVTQP